MVKKKFLPTKKKKIAEKKKMYREIERNAIMWQHKNMGIGVTDKIVSLLPGWQCANDIRPSADCVDSSEKLLSGAPV